MKKFNLFGKSAATKFVPIGDEEIGIIYLLKRGVIVAKENPTDLQEADRRTARLIVLMRTAGKRLAQSKAIDFKEAVARLSPRMVEGVQILAQEEMEDWLSTQEKEEYYTLAASSSAKKKAATLFIRHRLGYAVTVTETASAKASDISVEPLRFPLAIGDVIKFGQHRIDVTEPAEIGDERIYTRPLPQLLNAEDVGFLIDPYTGKEKVGMTESRNPTLSMDHAREFAGHLSQYGYDGNESQKIAQRLMSWLEDQSGWTMSDTDELEDPQIDAIYRFYQSELGMAAGEDEAEAEGKSPAAETSSEKPLSLNPSPTAPLSSGGEYYARIQSYGITDPIFHADNFGDCPIGLIFEMIQFQEKRQREQANLDTRIHAIGWSALFNSFLSKEEKHKAMNWEDLLPFSTESKDKARISRYTAETYTKLRGNGLVPVHVIGAFRLLDEEINELCKNP
jgi:hypothetical protein